MADEGSERRRFPRLKRSCSLRYRHIEGESLPTEGQEALSVNISGGGISFQVPESVEPGVLLALELTLPEFDAPVVSLGRTVWCDPADDGFQVGVEFWWIGWGDDGAQRAIADSIKKALES
jgi:hypothetical protein